MLIKLCFKCFAKYAFVLPLNEKKNCQISFFLNFGPIFPFFFFFLKGVRLAVNLDGFYEFLKKSRNPR